MPDVCTPFREHYERSRMVRDRIGPDATFDLEIGPSNRPCCAAETALRQLTRDLAEAFKSRIPEHPQVEGTLGCIERFDLEAGTEGPAAALRRVWRV